VCVGLAGEKFLDRQALVHRARPNWMALKRTFLLFLILAISHATVPLKVLTLQQLNS
jgi:hypothetical protein